MTTAEIISDKVVKGERQITIKAPLGGQWTVMLINEQGFYRLGGQLEDIVYGQTLADSKEVFWNQHEQEWERSRAAM